MTLAISSLWKKASCVRGHDDVSSCSGELRSNLELWRIVAGDQSSHPQKLVDVLDLVGELSIGLLGPSFHGQAHRDGYQASDQTGV